MSQENLGQQVQVSSPVNQEVRQIHNIPQRQNENSSLIQALKQTPNFLVQKYNQKMKQQNPSRPMRAGGVYVPPHRLRQMQQQMLKKESGGMEHQRMMWQLLRKSINGIVNKVNISNIQNIVIQLFNQNILRGKGLLAKSIIKAQMASPNFTHVYSALIAVINTKLPQIGNLILKRVMIQFKRAFQRNNKIVCIATTKMIAHLINQKVLGEYAGLQLLFILLNQPTQASVQIACDFMIEAGQVLSEITPVGANAIFQRFKTLLHEAQISQKAQYSIESLFAVRKTGFKQHPGVIPELDLVQAEDQITHNLDFQDQLTGEQNINIFKFDPFYQKTQEQWESVKLQILGQENIINLKQIRNYEQQMLDQEQMMEQQQNENKIQDLTEQDLVNLRRTIYLIIQSTVNFQQCAHKLLKMNIAKGYEHELVDMIIQCCMMERIYQNFFGLLAQRFCTIDDLYKELFIKAFINHYNTIFKLQVNKIRNLGRLFGHLLHRFAIDWTIFQVIVLKPQTTTAAGRMFLKILFKEVSQNMGMQKLIQQFSKQQMRQYYQGLFPIDHPNNLRFSINYFTSIGLGPLTENMRQILAMQEEIIMNRKQKQEEEKIMQQLKEQQDMLRLMEEEQLKQKQILEKQNQVREQQRQKQKLKRQEDQKRRKNEARSKQNKYDSRRKNDRKRSESSSSSSSSGSSSGSSSSSNSSNQSQTPVKLRQKYKNRKAGSKRSRSSSSSSGNEGKNNKGGRLSSQTDKRRTDDRQRSRQKHPNKQSQKKQQESRKAVQIKKRRQSSSSSQQKPTRAKLSREGQQKEKQSNLKIKLEQEKVVSKSNLLKKVVSQENSKQKTKKKRVQSSDSQSSGISSSSNDQSQQSGQLSESSQNVRKTQTNKKRLKQGKVASVKNKKQSSTVKRKQSDDSSSNSSSSSSEESSVDTNELYRRKLKKQGKN